MKVFEVKVTLHGTTRVEPPTCPSRWMGSGCYDIDVPASCDAVLTIPARNEIEANSIAERFDYNSSLETLNRVEVVGITLSGVTDDDDTEIEVEYGDIKEQGYFYPDPDEYYDEQRLREHELE